jgi:hypothetical protein
MGVEALAHVAAEGPGSASRQSVADGQVQRLRDVYY